MIHKNGGTRGFSSAFTPAMYTATFVLSNQAGCSATRIGTRILSSENRAGKPPRSRRRRPRGLSPSDEDRRTGAGGLAAMSVRMRRVRHPTTVRRLAKERQALPSAEMSELANDNQGRRDIRRGSRIERNEYVALRQAARAVAACSFGTVVQGLDAQSSDPWICGEAVVPTHGAPTVLDTICEVDAARGSEAWWNTFRFRFENIAINLTGLFAEIRVRSSDFRQEVFPGGVVRHPEVAQHGWPYWLVPTVCWKRWEWIVKRSTPPSMRRWTMLPSCWRTQ
jgi:hypothetical protein